MYVDGFNFYYGAVKDTAYKWCDLGRLFQLLLPGNDIQRIRYFTALNAAAGGPAEGVAPRYQISAPWHFLNFFPLPQ